MRPLLLLALSASLCPAQDVVTLHGVTISATNQVTVVYSKNFATCAHMRFSNATCTQTGGLTHAANMFCAQGSFVGVTVPAASFLAGFGIGTNVFLVHGNNGGVASACIAVAYDGAYGTGCAGTLGAPALDSSDEAAPAGTTCTFALQNGLPGSVAVLGLGLGQASIPVLGCDLLLGSVLGTVAIPFDGSGAGSFPFPLPLGSTGIEFTAQAFALDPSGPQGFTASNGLLVKVQ
ncbi:MAG: hypothetical protein JNK15_24955 [Planctomycetes bacterium]|nr:hypothetical protein [Planctomycetota bacterium]